MCKQKTLFLLCALLTSLSTVIAQDVPAVTWDSKSLIMDGRRVCPVMGEMHYSRIPADEWADEIRKVKEGGVTMIATYVFWNHIEEQEGIFRWDGQRSLRSFLEACKEEQMPVVLRIGPFCHGEVRNGGFPDWIFTKGIKLRDTNPAFLAYVEKLYRQVYTQVQGLQWKDGGPVIAAQFDNEFRGRGEYLMTLKEIAEKVGFDLPFYTRTGWPELRTPVPFGEMLPLYGDYADGFWDKDISEGCGNYYKAFNFKAFRSSTAIATDQFVYSQNANSQQPMANSQYPYFTCELGGGMATAYHRRPYLYPEDAYSMALVKLGSGSNLLGYYMYHGGTNPEGVLHTLNECQTSPGTANNDLPVMTYDFQAPLGEYGQAYPQYYMLRPLHLFMHDWGEALAPMEASFPAPQDLKKGEDGQLRWAVRSEGAKSEKSGSGFIFINNYERFCKLSEKKNVQLEACGVKLPKLTIPSGCMAIFPLNIDGIRYATAQLVARRKGKIYMMQIPGISTAISLQNGKTLKNVKPRGTEIPVYDNIYLITKAEAENLFLDNGSGLMAQVSRVQEVQEFNNFQFSILNCQFSKIKEAGPMRSIVKGKAKVAEAPSEEDWLQAAIYQITLPKDSSLFTLHSSLLSINYRGDCARLYADGRLVADNFYYGRPFQFGLWRLSNSVKELELRILPFQPDAPIYLPRESDKSPGEQVNKIEIYLDNR
ncbi:MAG: beta-galactosidase [Bacteroidaceae bacterium]|nr:beta-galactosidase [Bacteroidaceae bacterium]